MRREENQWSVPHWASHCWGLGLSPAGALWVTAGTGPLQIREAGYLSPNCIPHCLRFAPGDGKSPALPSCPRHRSSKTYTGAAGKSSTGILTERLRSGGGKLSACIDNVHHSFRWTSGEYSRYLINVTWIGLLRRFKVTRESRKKSMASNNVILRTAFQ